MRNFFRRFIRLIRPKQQLPAQPPDLPAENTKVFLNLEGFADLDTADQRERVANFLKALSRNPEVRAQAYEAQNKGKDQQ